MGRVAVATEEAESAPPKEDALLRFGRMLQSVGGGFEVVPDRAAAGATIRRIVHEAQATTVAVSDATLLADIHVASHLGPGASTAELLDADVGITTAQLGIAETGTLVLTSDDERHRLVSLLPPLHIAVLPRSRLVDNLEDALAAVARDAPADMSRAVTFITGPSRTADIELTLVVGVHGPRQLTVIVLANE